MTAPGSLSGPVLPPTRSRPHPRLHAAIAQLATFNADPGDHA
jgi:hypothetical protein